MRKKRADFQKPLSGSVTVDHLMNIAQQSVMEVTGLVGADVPTAAGL